MKIAVLANVGNYESDGHRYLEYDSMSTVNSIAAALETRHEVTKVVCGRNIASWVEELLAFEPDLVFSVCEGYGGVARESVYPGIFEELGMVYSGPDPTTAIVTHNKFLTKQIVKSAGIPVPKGIIVSSAAALEKHRFGLEFPMIVKPNSEGSSIGLSEDSVVHDRIALTERCEYVLSATNNLALVEEFVPRGLDVSMSFVEGLNEGGIFGPIAYNISGSIFGGTEKSGASPVSVWNKQTVACGEWH